MLPGEVVPRPCRAAWRRRPAREFSVLPPENATGNFTKIVQRVPVRVLLDDGAADAGQAAAWPVGHRRSVRRAMSTTTAECRSWHAGELPMATKVFAFASMCVGFFIALLDIQIVSASLADIGGGLSAGADEVAWVQTSYLIAEIIVIPLSGWLSRVMSTRWLFCALGGGLHHHQPAVRLGVEHREHDRVPRAARLSRRLDDPDRVHHGLHLLQQPAAGDRRGDHRLHLVAGADVGADHRRLDHRQLLLALAVLHQPGARHLRLHRGADAGARRPAEPRHCCAAPITSAWR